MTEKRTRSPLPVVGLVAVAAAALLFVGVWTQAGRAENWAGAPAQAHHGACQAPTGPEGPDFA